jgi:hypothetical protein
MDQKLREVAVVAVLLGLVNGLWAAASVSQAAAGWEKNPDKKAKIWDAMKKYDYKFYAFDKAAWPDRAEWKQVPWGTLDYKFVGDAIIENGNFWLFLKSSPYDSPFLYANIDGKPAGNLSELYTRSKDWIYNHMPVNLKVLKNTPDEVIVEYEGNLGRYDSPKYQHKRGKTLIVKYRVLRNRCWIEVKPMGGAGRCRPYQQSHHTCPDRFAVAPSNRAGGNDYVVDCLKVPYGKYAEYPLPAENNRLLLVLSTFSREHHMHMLTWPDPQTAGPTIGGNGKRQKLPRIQTINALFGGEKGEKPVIVGVINRRHVFHHEDIGRPITAGGKHVSSWKPPYAGVWRMTGRVTDGKSKYYPDSGTPHESDPSVLRGARVDYKHYTNTIVVKQGAQNPFTFTSPVEGTLEYVIMYLYDRTDETPPDLSTPMDVYREAVLGKPASSR